MDTNGKYKNLRRRTNNPNDDRWNLQNLKDGFEYFFELYNRYPTVKEIDTFEYLPTSRTIQRSFGGLMSLRKELGLDSPTNFSSGVTRSNKAREVDKRAKKYEEDFYYYLISKIEEVRVHEHKIIRPGDTASDFFIYIDGKNGIVIDLFYAADMHSLGGVVNIKIKKYKDVKHPVYFILVGNENITQSMISSKIENRKSMLPNHIRVISEREFKENIDLLIR
jgi:hypothetical protein